MGGRPLERALISRTTALADGVIAKYQDPSVIVWESQWRQAREALEHALRRNRSNRSRQAALRYCEGQLHRIDGEARTAELRAAAEKGDTRKGARRRDRRRSASWRRRSRRFARRPSCGRTGPIRSSA